MARYIVTIDDPQESMSPAYMQGGFCKHIERVLSSVVQVEVVTADKAPSGSILTPEEYVAAVKWRDAFLNNGDHDESLPPLPHQLVAYLVGNSVIMHTYPHKKEQA